MTTVTFNWAVVEQDGSVVDRYATRDDAVRNLSEYADSTLSVEWVADPTM